MKSITDGLDPVTGYPKSHKLLEQEMGKALRKALRSIRADPVAYRAYLKLKRYMKAAAKTR